MALMNRSAAKFSLVSPNISNAFGVGTKASLASFQRPLQRSEFITVIAIADDGVSSKSLRVLIEGTSSGLLHINPESLRSSVISAPLFLEIMGKQMLYQQLRIDISTKIFLCKFNFSSELFAIFR